MLGTCLCWPGISQAQQEAGTTGSDLWYWEAPYGTILVVLFVGLLFTILLILGMYRLLLKSQVQKGLHPHMLGWTLGLFFSGVYLLLAIFFLYHSHSIGLGIFTLVATVLIFFLLIMLFLGKVMNLLWFFVIIAIALIVFQVFNP